MMGMPFNFGNMSPQQILQQMMQSNPQMQNNPQAQHYIQVLMSGNQEEGIKLAQNLCQSYNVTPEQGVQQAQSFISKMFGR